MGFRAGNVVAAMLREDSSLTQVRGAGHAEFSLDEEEQFFANRMASAIFPLNPLPTPQFSQT